MLQFVGRKGTWLRNILVNREKCFKIVDCEFASETHFHQEDWLRLHKFTSVKKFSENKIFKEILTHDNNHLEVYHLLKQILLHLETNSENQNFQYIASDSLSLLKRLYSLESVKSIFAEAIILQNNVFAENIKFLENNNKTLAEDYKALANANDNLAEKNKVLANANDNLAEKNKVLANANDNLAEKNKVLANANDNLAEKNKVLANANDNLVEDNASTANKLEYAYDKIKRMEKSFSWKYTSIFRFLRRKTLDRFCKTKSLPPMHSRNAYEKWIELNEVNTKVPNEIVKELEYKPLISVIMPVCDTKDCFLEEAINSVLQQSYSNFELCIADDASNSPEIKKILDKLLEKDPRIKVIYRNQRGNISNATTSALSLAKGQYVGFLDHDDILHCNALYEVVRSINNDRRIRLIYTDEDKINESGTRISPYFKPDWNLNLFLSQNYLCHFVVIEKTTFDKFGKFRSICDGAQDWDNLLHIIPNIAENEIFHIPKILYHWRIHKESTALSVGAKKNVITASTKALSDFCEANSLNAKVNLVQEYYFHLYFKIPSKPPLVSIIIPTKDNFELLSKCLKVFNEILLTRTSG